MPCRNKVRSFNCLTCGKQETKRCQPGTKYCSLECYRKERPSRKTGKIVKCNFCSKEVYKSKVFLRKSINHFCSKDCTNKFKIKPKLYFNCKTCSKEFCWSKSRLKQANPKYCCMICRNKDTEHMVRTGVNSTLIQQKEKGLNKLEIKGREILTSFNIEFKEQELMFNKFLVDVLIESKKLIIQWDGEYWHTKPKRKALDKSQDSYLNKCGYIVLRITDKEIKNNLTQVYANITKSVQ